MIPEISFTPVNGKKSIEVIDLSSIQARQSTLDHNPEYPHRVKFHLLLFIEQGRGKHFIDFHHYSFAPNSLIFISKQQVHAFDFSQNPKGKVILFTDEFITQAQTNINIPLFNTFHMTSQWKPVFKPKPDLLERCKTLLCEAEHELQDPHCQEIIVMMLFSALLMMIARERTDIPDSLNKRQLKTFQRFTELVEQHFCKTRDARNYSDLLHITYKTLNKACKEVRQQTPKQIIDQYTVMEAKRRLVIDNIPVQQLAYELGFDDPTNFVKYFRKHTARTPLEFRKEKG